MSSKSYVQVPPQSTGKKLVTEFRKEVYFDNLSGSLEPGDIVIGAASGATGEITAIITEGFGSNAGELYLKEFTGNFQNNEDLQVGGITQAQVDLTIPQQEYDIQKFVLTDPSNLENNQRIDRFGASVNTFTDGAPVFGPFGTLTVGEPQIVKEYRFAYDSDPNNFYDFSSTGGAISYESAIGAILFLTNSSSGSTARRTSHFYHPYIPGVGSLLEMTVRIGDTGKIGVVRRWGYYDNNNGFFFELDGTSLYTVIRSNTTGTPVDTRIAQTDWNTDKLNGSGSIGFNLDLTKGNIYWIDFQWLGAGRVRFGVIEPDGAKIVAHVIKNANTNASFPYTRTATLPIRLEQFNESLVASSSEMRFVCAVIKNTSKSNQLGEKFTRDSGIKTVATASGELPILSLRPKLTYEGLNNHGYAKIISASLMNIVDNVSEPNNAVVFRIRRGLPANLTGASWQSQANNSIVEYDVTASAINSGATKALSSLVIGPNASQLFSENTPRELHAYELYNHADESTQPIFTITAQCINGTAAKTYVTFNWEEIKV